MNHYVAKDYKSAISSYNRALTSRGASSQEQALLGALFNDLSQHYVPLAKASINRGVVPSHDFVAAISYKLASIHVQPPLSHTKCMLDSMNKILDFLDTQTCVPMEHAILLYKQGQQLFKKSKTDIQVGQLWLRALSVFIPRASVLVNRTLAHADMGLFTESLVDSITTLLLDSTISDITMCQADALYHLKEYELAKLMCDRGVKLRKRQNLITEFIKIGQFVREATSAASSSACKSSSSENLALFKGAIVALSTSASRPSEDSSSLSAPTTVDWISLATQGEILRDAEKYDQAIAYFTRALHCDARTKLESKLLTALLASVCEYYSSSVSTVIDGGKIAPSHTDVLNALSYGIAAYAIDATSTRSLHSAFMLLARYFLLGLSDSSVLTWIMNEITVPSISNELICRLAMRFLCDEQEAHLLDRATLVKVKDSQVMKISNAAQLFKQGRKMCRRGNDKVAIKLWMRALTLFVHRSGLLTNRSCCYLRQHVPFNALLDTHTALLLESEISQVTSMRNQACALEMLKENEAAATVCRRGLKMKFDDTKHLTLSTLQHILDDVTKEAASSASSSSSALTSSVSSSPSAPSTSSWSMPSDLAMNAYLTGIQKRFPVDSSEHIRFLSLMDEHNHKKATRDQTMNVLSQLFNGEKNLLIGFKFVTQLMETEHASQESSPASDASGTSAVSSSSSSTCSSS